MKTRNTPTRTCICSKLPDEPVNTMLVAPRGPGSHPLGLLPTPAVDTSARGWLPSPGKRTPYFYLSCS